MSGFFFFVWWLDHPRSRGDALVGMLPWMPWALAALVTTKVWIATLDCRESASPAFRLRAAVSRHTHGVWLAATACLVLYAWLLSPRIEWFRNTALLAGLCAIPAIGIAIAPLTIAWNRHR